MWTIKGSDLGLDFVLNIDSIAVLYDISQPNPNTVSVGKLTRYPKFSLLIANSRLIIWQILVFFLKSLIFWIFDKLFYLSNLNWSKKFIF